MSAPRSSAGLCASDERAGLDVLDRTRRTAEQDLHLSAEQIGQGGCDPAIGHMGHGSWYGVAAPRNTPADIVDKLNKEINAALADAKLKARIADLGGSILGGSPADFGKLIADETEKWAKVIRAANIKLE